MFRQNLDKQRLRLISVTISLALASLVAACSISTRRENPPAPYASQPTDTPMPDLTGTVEVQQTQTAAPVATMFARLDRTAQARSTIQALTPSPTPTPSPTRGPISATILEDFPLEVGITWVYSVTFVTGHLNEDLEFEEIRYTGTITETITGKSLIDDTLVFTATLSQALTETITLRGEVEDTVIATNTMQQYNDTNRLYKVVGKSVYRNNFEILREPLEVGQEWTPFSEETLEDVAEGWYVWRVLKQDNIVTQAGTFQNCVYLVLMTTPDHSLNWFCPGVGFAYQEYHHHGTPGDQYWELQEIRRP